MMDMASKVHTRKIDKLFVLVHGTWAPNSRWTQNGESLLCEMLKSAFQAKQDELIEICAPTWSGKNRESHRIAGGRQIAKQVGEKLKGDECDESTDVFFLAHSHGTDVALKALEEIGNDARIRGLAAFNSPNILTLKRDFAASIGQLVRFAKISAFFVFLTSLSLITISMLADVGQTSIMSNLLLLLRSIVSICFDLKICGNHCQSFGPIYR